MEKLADVKYQTTSLGMRLEYLQDGSITVNGNHVDKGILEDANKEYKGCNRIYKPIALLFWIDCKNGNFSNWK